MTSNPQFVSRHWLTTKTDIAKEMDSGAQTAQQIAEAKLMEHLGRDQTFGTVQKVQELLESERFKHQA